jgi:hypothetical protein
MTPSLVCYRLDHNMPYDSESVWALVQRHQGHLSIRVDHILFWLDPYWECLLIMSFPQLRRVRKEDYV